MRHDLACFKDRLQSLEAHVAKTSGIPTESRLQAIEGKQQEKEAHGDIETEHPRYLGSQDTYYAGRLKGGSRV